MTRSEFISWNPTIGELIDFCNSNDIDALCDIYDEDERDDKIWEEINEFDGTWSSLASYLDQIPCGYDYYEKDDSMWFEYVGIENSDIPDLKNRIIEEADSLEIWDDERDISDEWLLYDDESEDSDAETNVEGDTVFEAVMSLEELYAAGAVFTNN